MYSAWISHRRRHLPITVAAWPHGHLSCITTSWTCIIYCARSVAAHCNRATLSILAVACPSPPPTNIHPLPTLPPPPPVPSHRCAVPSTANPNHPSLHYYAFLALARLESHYLSVCIQLVRDGEGWWALIPPFTSGGNTGFEPRHTLDCPEHARRLVRLARE